MESPSILRLLQLVSPTLPVGAYAYSQALEQAVHLQWVHDQQSARQWIGDLLCYGLGQLDLPVLIRLYQAWQQNSPDQLDEWSRFLLTSRESAELMAEDQNLGIALARLLKSLQVAYAEQWQKKDCTTYAALFSLAASAWQISAQHCLFAYAWSWCENQVAAAIKLVPLGQTAGQQILFDLNDDILKVCQKAMQMADDDIGSLLPGHAIASCHHESLYCRLFIS